MKPQALYTIGYQGVSVEVVIADLKQHNVKKLIDVRRNAISRKNGFSKTALKKACESVQIEYIHIPQLGIPGEMRQGLKANWQYIKLLDDYERNMLPDKEEFVRELKDIVEVATSALLCFESAPQLCHRSRLAAKLEELSHLRVRHLEPAWDLVSG